FAAEYPEANRKKVMAALNREDVKFVGGRFINWFTTMWYDGDTKALNLFLDDLAHIPGVVLHVSFGKSVHPGAWSVHHEAHDNRFHIKVNLDSKIKLAELYIPEIRGIDPIETRDNMTKLGPEEFDDKPGRGWRAFSDKRLFADAAQVIDRYLSGHGGLTEERLASLHFHAAQNHAWHGTNAAMKKAFKHLEQARLKTEEGKTGNWNSYVDATEAFLKKDLVALKNARAQLAKTPVKDGKIPNLATVDRLIQMFDDNYRQAYFNGLELFVN
ncbi:MAG: hypothetical protein ACPGVU_24210, partial [Limisphaerales bacterium]